MLISGLYIPLSRGIVMAAEIDDTPFLIRNIQNRIMKISVLDSYSQQNHLVNPISFGLNFPSSGHKALPYLNEFHNTKFIDIL